MTRKYTMDDAWCSLLESINIDPHAVLKKADLPPHYYGLKRLQLTVEEYYRLWNSIFCLYSQPDLPLKIIKATTKDVLSPPIFASLCSPNFSVAITRLKQYKSLIGPVLVDATFDNKQNTVITISGFPDDDPLPYSIAIIDLLFTVHIIRMGTQTNVRPIAVEIAHEKPKEHLEVFTSFFGIKLKQGKTNRIVFSNASMQLPFKTVDNALWHAFETELKKGLRELEKSNSFSEKVYVCLIDTLASGDVSIKRIANMLAISPRTLQRRLTEESNSFQKIRQEVRTKLAIHYLSNSTYSNQEVAFLLGFDDSNSFFRAFKLWTNTTPESVRQSKI